MHAREYLGHTGMDLAKARTRSDGLATTDAGGPVVGLANVAEGRHSGAGGCATDAGVVPRMLGGV